MYEADYTNFSVDNLNFLIYTGFVSFFDKELDYTNFINKGTLLGCRG